MRRNLIRLSINLCRQRLPTMRMSQTPQFSFGQTFEFKAETKKLLDIVAKSLYTDKDVFLRELLSNASDALEKQRFLSSTVDDVSDQLEIRVELDENARTISITDTGVGMSKLEMIDNLGTIAKSGSKQFLEQDSNKSISDKIIGQFGVGFYSSFIVGDTVEVVSRSEKEKKTYMWVSDGTGEFEVSEVPEDFQPRGTRITIHLKPECAQFCKQSEVQKTIQRYSNFIGFPIKINGENLNLVQAIWTRNKSEISAEEYNKFYEFISNSKLNYRYKLHYTTDAPLSIKALLFIPSTHMERYGMQQEEYDVHLYCKKVLIKKNCREIIPSYLRFVKGVVDCEDLPLNISREHYQDTQLIAKLKSIITKRIIKELEAQATSDPDTYLAWYNDFQYFIKEGIAQDDDNKQALLKLLRFQTNQSEEHISLDQYIAKLPKTQESIYFLLAPTRAQALSSPYMEPFTHSETPILFTYLHIDEMVFKGVQQYQNKSFVNIESDQQEVQKTIKEVKHDTLKGLPQDELTSFSLWLKNELAPSIAQVQVSKRLQESPAIIVSAISSGMRQVMAMMDKTQIQEMTKNLTLEINPNHPIIVNLNRIRKTDRKIAALISRQILDNCMLSAGLLSDPKSIVDRSNNLVQLFLEKETSAPQVEQNTEAHREEHQKESIDDDTEIIIDNDGTPRVVSKKQQTK